MIEVALGLSIRLKSELERFAFGGVIGGAAAPWDGSVLDSGVMG